MRNLNKLIDKTWDREKFIDKQRRRRKYRFFIRIKNNVILYWLSLKDIFNFLQLMCARKVEDRLINKVKNKQNGIIQKVIKND